MLQLKKQDITALPHNEICGLTETELEAWANKTMLKRYEQWLLPQMVAHFGSWQLVFSDNRIDIRQTLKLNCESNTLAQACWRLSRLSRSTLVIKQTALPEYGALTPLILAGFKRMQGVDYECWRGLEHLEYVVEPRLLEAVCVDYSDLGSERLLEIRQQGLMTRSGKTAGQLKPAETTWSLTGISDTELGHLPKLTQTILTQIWLAHPQHRSNLMILDPNNWDKMPEPLITNNVFKSPEPKEIAPLKTESKKATQLEPEKLLPWM